MGRLAHFLRKMLILGLLKPKRRPEKFWGVFTQVYPELLWAVYQKKEATKILNRDPKVLLLQYIFLELNFHFIIRLSIIRVMRAAREPRWYRPPSRWSDHRNPGGKLMFGLNPETPLRFQQVSIWYFN